MKYDHTNNANKSQRLYWFQTILPRFGCLQGKGEFLVEHESSQNTSFLGISMLSCSFRSNHQLQRVVLKCSLNSTCGRTLLSHEQILEVCQTDKWNLWSIHTATPRISPFRSCYDCWTNLDYCNEASKLWVREHPALSLAYSLGKERFPASWRKLEMPRKGLSAPWERVSTGFPSLYGQL